MMERNKNVLIASLGDSPGVITSAIDALEKKGVKISKVITISTRGNETCLKDRNGNVIPAPNGFVELLKNEFASCNLEYQYDCTGSRDIEDEEECKDFLEIAVKYIKQCNQDGCSVYVCIAGGRKSMSVLLTIAAQFFGFKKIFHIAVINIGEREYIENNGSQILSLDNNNRNRILHPESAEIVELPVCNLSHFLKPELKTGESIEIFNVLLQYCSEIQEKINRDIPKTIQLESNR